MEEKAKVTISLTEGKLEISGSEDFVREQLDRFKDIIDNKLSAVPVQSPAPPPPTQTVPLAGENVQPAPAIDDNPYPNVIALDGDVIKLLKLTGKDNAEKTLSATLLFLLAKNLKGEESASSKELREVCKEHACLDAANFMTTLKRAKQFLIISGTRMKKSAKLSAPGLAQAKQLAADLNK